MCPVLIIIIFYLLSSSSPHALLCMVASIMSGCVLVGPSMFHMSAQQKKAARGPCFHIPYYQSDQIIQKTCRCILHSFACLAHWKKKIENWSATIFHLPCFQDAFHSSVTAVTMYSATTWYGIAKAENIRSQMFTTYFSFLFFFFFLFLILVSHDDVQRIIINCTGMINWVGAPSKLYHKFT